MSKSFLVTFCLLVALLATLATAAKVEVKFVDEKIIKGTTTWVNFKFTGINFNYPITFEPIYQDNEQTSGSHLWSFLRSRDDLSHNEVVRGYEPYTCHDAATKQVVGWATVNTNNIITLQIANPWSDYEAGFSRQLIAAAVASNPISVDSIQWDINCAISVNTAITPTAFFLAIQARDAAGTSITDINDTKLVAPTGGYVDPIIEFKKASIVQDSSDPFTSTVLSLEFTTDSPGVYRLWLENGPYADSRNWNNGEFNDWYCSSGSNKEFARIFPGEDTQIWVPSPSPKDPIKCKITYNNGQSSTYVSSERISAIISYGYVKVSRGLDMKQTPAAAFAQASDDLHTPYIRMASTELTMSKTPINNNSTIEFKFSKHIDVSKFLLQEDHRISDTTYQSNSNCFEDPSGSGILATAFVDIDANTITLKDVKIVGNYFSQLRCRFYFSDHKLPYEWQDNVHMASVHISIDGKSLVSQMTPGEDIPIYLRTNGYFDSDGFSSTTKLSEDGKSYQLTDIFNYRDNYEYYHTTMRHPLLVIGISATTSDRGSPGQLFNMANYKDQVQCEATSPTYTGFTPLKLTFDNKMFTWSVELKDLIKVESYSILIKCTRTIPRIVHFGVDMTPTASLKLSIVDLLDTKRFFSSRSATGSLLQILQATEHSGDYPSNSLYNYCVSARYYLPTLNQQQIDDAVAQHTTLSKELVAGVSSGWTFGNSGAPYHTNLSTELATDNIYTSTTGFIEAVKLFNTNAHDLKSFEYDTLDQFESFINSAAFDRQERSHSDYTKPLIQINQCYNIIKGSTAIDSTPSFGNNVNVKFFKSFLTLDITAKPVINYGLDLYPYYQSTSEVKGTGINNSFFALSSIDPGYDFQKDAQGYEYMTDSDTWKFIQAENGQSCVYNADCVSNSCQQDKCVVMPTYNPPFISIEVNDWSASPKAMDKAYFNTSHSISFTFAFVAFLATILF